MYKYSCDSGNGVKRCIRGGGDAKNDRAGALRVINAFSGEHISRIRDNGMHVVEVEGLWVLSQIGKGVEPC